MPPPPADPDDEIRALYHGPAGEFVAGRQALARRLRLARDDRAAEVARLRKPGLSAWAVDQLFAHEGEALGELLGAGERLHGLQRGVAEGGDPGGMRDLIAAIRRQVGSLTRRAVELVAAADRAPGEAIVERIRGNLEALALDPAAAAVAARRWLDEDLPPPGFEIMAALELAAARRRPPGPARPPAAVPAAALATVHRFDEGRDALVARREREEQEERERREREHRERKERLEAELARAEAAVAERRRAAEVAAAAAERAEREAAEAGRRAREARAGSGEVAHRAIEAEAEAARVREALAGLEPP